MINKLLQICSLLLIFSISSYANKNQEDIHLNHIALATLMIYDAKYDKARQELHLVDTNASSYDAANYYTVLGVLNSKQNRTKEAIKAFKQAIQATKIKEFKAPKKEKQKEFLFSIASKETNTEVSSTYDAEAKKRAKSQQLYMYLTQEYYKLKDYKNTVSSLENAKEKGKSRAGLFTLKAECYYKMKEYSKAINALNEGIQHFKKNKKLLKQKFYYFADLGLYQAAIQTAQEYIKLFKGDAKEYVTLAQVLIGANEIESAIKLLEEAKLKFPKEPKLSVLLGHMYLKKDMKHIAASLFEKGSYYDKKYLKDAVEMHRRAGNNLHALYLNAQNIDKVEKLKQKIAIYLNAGEYRKIIGLSKALKRYKMLDDDNLRYALAYAYYMAQDYKKAENELKFISDSELFNKATLIRKNIEQCTNNSLECL